MATKPQIPQEDFEELEQDEAERTEDEEFEILAELGTTPEELADKEAAKRYAAYLAQRLADPV